MEEFICMLCLEENKNLIHVASSEGIRRQISPIIYTHFPLCFEEPPRTGFICRVCWTKVEPFHEFYLIVEAIHKSFHEHAYVPDLDVNLVLKEESAERVDDIKIENEEKDDSFDMDNNSDFGSSDVSAAVPEANGNIIKTKKKRRKRAKKQPKKKKKKPKVIVPKFPYVADESGIFRCDQCSLPFLSAWKLDRHVKEIHMTLLFKCKETRCVESYATQEELDEHFKEKHLRIKCPHCDSYINSNSLQTHIEENHNREKEVLCDLCGVVCKNNSILHWHRTSVHEAEPRAQCDICKIWCKNRQSIRQHMRRKHINGPATCTICGKIFKGSHILHSHMKLHFTESREKHKCRYCGRGFPAKTKWREHEATHTGLDLYQCKNCGKSLRFSSSMSLHRKKCFA